MAYPIASEQLQSLFLQDHILAWLQSEKVKLLKLQTPQMIVIDGIATLSLKGFEKDIKSIDDLIYDRIEELKCHSSNLNFPGE